MGSIQPQALGLHQGGIQAICTLGSRFICSKQWHQQVSLVLLRSTSPGTTVMGQKRTQNPSTVSRIRVGNH